VFKPGDIVRHRTKPEWGPGRVTGQTVEGKVLIKFSARAGDVLLTAAGAEQHLQLATDANWQTAPRAVRREATVGRVPCSTCAVDVRESVTRSDGAWQACPQCSAQNGKQHVLRPYPEAFVLPGDAAPAPGPSGASATAPNPTPPAAAAAPTTADDPEKAAWCLNCRSNGRIPVAGFRVCAEFAR
jgi:hypothetical protein